MKRLFVLLVGAFLLVGQPVLAKEDRALQEEIIYDILVDRFNIGNLSLSEQVDKDDPKAYHGGDLLGITKKLDRIKQLGFTAITLSPIMKNAPNGYHGYWVEDFYEIEEQFGTMVELNKLIEEAHGRGIKVILELATNYVADSHPYVTDETKQDWFKENTVKQIPATYWLDNVAVLNQDNEEVADYLIDVAEYWMNETEIDGLKLHDADRSSVSFMEKLGSHLKELDPEFYLLAGVSAGEVGPYLEALNQNSYIDAVENKRMFETMNDVFTKAETPVSILFDSLDEDTSRTDLLFVDNKNTARFSNNFADNGRNALTTWKLTLAFMYTMPGVPAIYQGSELPMYGPGFPDNQHLVLFNSTDPDIEEYHDRISSLRREFPLLAYGDLELIGSSGAMSVYKRFDEEEAMYIAINNDSTSQTIPIKDVEEGKRLRGLLGDNLVKVSEAGEYKINIPRESAEVYIVEDDIGLNWLLIGFIVGVFILFIVAINYLSRQQKKREQT